jgi:hypothetical protein
MIAKLAATAPPPAPGPSKHQAPDADLSGTAEKPQFADGEPSPSAEPEEKSLPPSSPSEIRVLKFQAINAKGNADIQRHAPERPSARGIVNSLNREYTLDHLANSQIVGGERFFEVCWKDSVIEDKYINFPEGGGCFVLIDGEPWVAKDYTQIEGGESDVMHFKLQWPTTWKAERELEHARELIEEFENRKSGREAAAESPDHVHNSIERFTPVPESEPASSDEAEEAMADFEPEEMQRYKIPILRLQPTLGVEYSAADFREVIARTSGDSRPALKRWARAQDERAVIFRRSYIERGQGYDLGRTERAHAVFAQTSGEEQQRPCECCVNELGPFVECIVAPEFSGGACANCAVSTTAKRCNFHRECKSSSTRSNAKLIVLSYERVLAVYSRAVANTTELVSAERKGN